MNNILQDLSAACIINAIEGNLSAWLPELGKIGHFTQTEPPGVNRAIVDIPNALFNSVMDSRLDPADVEYTVQFVIADAKQRGVPLLWWTGPSTLPVDLGMILQKFGFTLDDDGPGMAVILAQLNESLPSPEGVSIQPAEDDACWMEWCRTMALGFEIPAARLGFAVESWHRFLRCADTEIVKLYVARLDGKPVATSLLFLAAGVAGIYAVSTVPDARHRGIGAHMTLFPLLKARDFGYTAGSLQASEMGEGVYRSLGFKEYCRIRSYRFQA